MSTPLPPRPSVGRSSFAIAMKDYTFIRPGIAVTISAVTLLAAFIFGLDLIHSLQRASTIVREGASVSQTLHSYSAAYEVWHQMATSTASADRTPQAAAQRDTLREHLRTNLSQLQKTLGEADKAEVQTILVGLASTDPTASTNARQAMTVLLGRQDAALFDAAETSHEGVLLTAVLLRLTLIAAATLVVPMSFLYIRYKRGATIEVKV